MDIKLSAIIVVKLLTRLPMKIANDRRFIKGVIFFYHIGNITPNLQSSQLLVSYYVRRNQNL